MPMSSIQSNLLCRGTSWPCGVCKSGARCGPHCSALFRIHGRGLRCMFDPSYLVQASDLVDIFVGSASSADTGPAAKQSQVEQLLDSQVPIPPSSSFCGADKRPHLK